MSETIVAKFTLDDLREHFQLAGYRVEAVTDPVVNMSYLRSATNGLAFDIRPGNRPAGDEQSFIDVSLIAVLQVQGELPLEVVNRWNATRRFARLQLSPPFLALSLDVSVAGGITLSNLRAQIEIWDHLVQQLVVFLREELAGLSNSRAQAAPADRVERSHSAELEASHSVQ